MTCHEDVQPIICDLRYFSHCNLYKNTKIQKLNRVSYKKYMNQKRMNFFLLTVTRDFLAHATQSTPPASTNT